MPKEKMKKIRISRCNHHAGNTQQLQLFPIQRIAWKITIYIVDGQKECIWYKSELFSNL